jgi:plastocyanin
MKKTLQFLVVLFFSGAVYAGTVNINTVGNSYSPSDVTVNVGDVVNIFAVSQHPTTQVSQATWNTNQTTPIGGAMFVSETSTINFNITAGMAGTTIYYVCENHVGSNGMKGKITVNVTTGLEENFTRDFNFTIYPNPVKNNSVLNISLKNPDRVSVKIFGMDGRMVSNYLDQKMNAGAYTLPFNAAKLGSGIYIMQLHTAKGVLRKQIVVAD